MNRLKDSCETTEPQRSKSNKYFTGKPCVRGHVADRYDVNGLCVVCAAENLKRHRDENPDLYAAYQRKRAPQRLAAEWKDREAYLKKKRELHSARADEINARRRELRRARHGS